MCLRSRGRAEFHPAAAGKVSRRRQPNFGRRAGAPAGFGSRQPKSGGGAAEGSTPLLRLSNCNYGFSLILCSFIVFLFYCACAVLHVA